VLRLGKGNDILLCDGEGMDYNAVIEDVTGSSIGLRITDSYPNEIEPPVRVTLYQSVPKGDRMDLIIQKGVELGVTEIVPVTTQRTVVRFESDRDKANKAIRWSRISLEAAKQCGRGKIPVVSMPLSFNEALKKCTFSELSIIPYELDRMGSIKGVLGNSKAADIALIIGPEGGFTEDEISRAKEAGCKSVTLGPRILRVETAAIAALSVLMYELGDLGK
jgi:16S rRNA (uracil1498-N3)-methyltransferase